MTLHTSAYSELIFSSSSKRVQRRQLPQQQLVPPACCDFLTTEPHRLRRVSTPLQLGHNYATSQSQKGTTEERTEPCGRPWRSTCGLLSVPLSRTLAWRLLRNPVTNRTILVLTPLRRSVFSKSSLHTRSCALEKSKRSKMVLRAGLA